MLVRVRSVLIPIAALVAAVNLAGLSAQTPTPAPVPPQSQPIFRSNTVLIPVDVRVLDKNGKPITDLEVSNFTLTENGVPQQIKQFLVQTQTPGVADSTVPIRRGATAAPLEPQTRRLFLIVLGRGRLQEPSKGLDAVIRFVRERLMPQDLVALMAWNRATDFSTNRESALAVLQRFKLKHEDIETDISLYFSGLAAVYAGKALPNYIQTKIDYVFSGADTRQVLPGPETRGAEAAGRAQADLLLRKTEIEARADLFRQFGGSDVAMADLMGDTTFGMNFDEYVALNRQTMQDVGNLYAGIEYLRFIDGEKHLIFLTEQGFYLPSADDDRSVGARAADARVVLDTIHTGGVASFFNPNTGIASVSPTNSFALGALRTLSDVSGGQASISQYAEAAFDRILNATGFGYVLGYTPTNLALDGRVRQIKVTVDRKNVTVSHRRGYFAKPEEGFDPRRMIATTRMVTAANFGDNIKDLKLSVKATDVKGGTKSVLIETTIDADRLVFADVNGRHVAALSQAIICTDGQGKTVGEIWRTVDISVPESLMEQVKQQGLRVNVQLPVTIPPVFVKVIVYDYGSDLVGTLLTRMH